VDRRLLVGGFQITETTHAPGTRLVRHVHEDPAITLVLGGAFEETFRHGPVLCRAGGLLFKAPGEPHGNRYGERGARSLLMDPRVMDEERRRLVAPLFDGVHYRPDGAANRIGRQVARELRNADAPATLAIEGLLLELLAAALRTRGESLGPRDPAWLVRAVELLHAHFAERVTLTQLAHASGVPAVRLARAFRHRIGLSPGALQRRLRVQWAADELLRTDRALSDVALAAGFADQSHFTRVFARIVGVTPAAHRAARAKRSTPPSDRCKT
jgi:AraC family transcriptional regulator